MIVSIKKWGNSASIRIPATLLDAANLVIDQEVELTEENGRLIVQPVLRPRYDLHELVEGITDENRHDLILDGPPVGKEVW